VTEGNYDALAMVRTCKRLFERIGLRPERLRLEWVSAGEGIRFANIMNEYAAQVQALGPVGKGEGLDAEELKFRLEAATRILPWLRLVLAQRLRVSPRTEEAYLRFFESAEFERLFEELVADKLVQSELTLLLSAKPASTSELAQRLRLSPAELSRHLRDSSRQGLVRFDPTRGSYSLA
jgi:DNA-binding transcriptional ArsR family regulator